MSPSSWSKSKRLCAGATALSTLAACPQLLEDDFSTGPLTTSPGGSASMLSGGAAGEVNTGGAGAAGTASSGGSGGSGGSATGQGGVEVDAALIVSVRQALVHRYAFDGIGTSAVDAMGGLPGALINTTLEGLGYVDLAGDDVELVNLPNGYLSASDDKTIECWVTWRGGDPWQRIFDFGESDEGETQRGVGMTYLFLTPQAVDGWMMAGFSLSGIQGEIQLTGTSALPIGTRTHVAVVVDSRRDDFSLYVNGELDATQVLEQRLSAVNDVNSWLGVSQYGVDPSLNAEIHEFRIYERALTADQLRLTYELGPDTL